MLDTRIGTFEHTEVSGIVTDTNNKNNLTGHIDESGNVTKEATLEHTEVSAVVTEEGTPTH